MRPIAPWSYCYPRARSTDVHARRRTGDPALATTAPAGGRRPPGPADGQRARRAMRRTDVAPAPFIDAWPWLGRMTVFCSAYDESALIASKKTRRTRRVLSTGGGRGRRGCRSCWVHSSPRARSEARAHLTFDLERCKCKTYCECSAATEVQQISA